MTMNRSALYSALAVIVAALAGLVYTVVAGNSPLLGLDLQGGVSVVLEPTSTEEAEVTDEALDLTVELLRGRIDEIGVAEPEISRQGTNIVVALPGVVEEQEQALERLQQTAELRFRPVIADLGPALSLDDTGDLTVTDADGNPVDLSDLEDGGDGAGNGDVGDGTDGETSDPDADTSTSNGDDGGDDPLGGEEESLAPIGRFSPALPAQSSDDGESDDTTTTTSDDDATSTTVADAGTGTEDAPALDQSTLSPAQLAAFQACGIPGVTPDDDDEADAYVVLADTNGNRLCLGPTLLTGEVVETADVALGLGGAGWEVNPTFRPGEQGIDQFNEVADLCFNADPEICPTRRLAVVLDHTVISAPSINAQRFARDQIVISGDFEEDEARLLAESLRFGALPLELVAQEIRTVSATIGRDVLQSGAIAGLIGLALVAAYLIAYYRLAGLVAIGGLALSAALLWTIVAWFGETYGLALSLAGVVGLIVSVGVSADSNIVYFENVKEAYMSGRRVPTAIERAYRSAISTIIKADVVSLIAAVLLYLLTVGAVRGFAFYLGLATILDLIISVMFMRPALAWLARRSAVERNPRLLGLPKFLGGTT
jgi:preprotein translocase subunit SecD